MVPEIATKSCIEVITSDGYWEFLEIKKIIIPIYFYSQGLLQKFLVVMSENFEYQKQKLLEKRMIFHSHSSRNPIFFSQ